MLSFLPLAGLAAGHSFEAANHVIQPTVIDHQQVRHAAKQWVRHAQPVTHGGTVAVQVYIQRLIQAYELRGLLPGIRTRLEAAPAGRKLPDNPAVNAQNARKFRLVQAKQPGDLQRGLCQPARIIVYVVYPENHAGIPTPAASQADKRR